MGHKQLLKIPRMAPRCWLGTHRALFVCCHLRVSDKLLSDQVQLILCSELFKFVLILPSGKVGCEILQIFMIRQCTITFRANFIYKVGTFGRSLQVSGTMHWQPEIHSGWIREGYFKEEKWVPLNQMKARRQLLGDSQSLKFSPYHKKLGNLEK